MRGRSAILFFGFGLVCLILGIAIDRKLLPPRPRSISAAPETSNQASASKRGSTNKPKGNRHADQPEEGDAPKTVMRTLGEVGSAIRGALTNSVFEKRGEMLEQIAASVEEKDIAEALTLGESIPNSDLRMRFRDGLLSKLAETDPKGAIAYAQKISNLSHRESAMGSIIGVWANADPDQAYAWVDQLSPGAAKTTHYQTILPVIARKDRLRAIQLMEKLPGQQRRNVTWPIFNAWSENDPEGMIKWVGQQAPSQLKDDALSTLVQQIAQTDTKRAVELAETARPGQARRYAISMAIGQSWENDPGGTLARIKDLTDTDTRDMALRMIAQRGDVEKLGFASTMAFITNLPPSSARNDLVRNLLLRSDQPKSQATWELLQSLTSDSPRGHRYGNGSTDYTINAFATSWAETDLAGALDWARALPEGQSSQALNAMAWTVAKSDSKRIDDVIQSVPEGKVRNELIKSFGSAMANDDFDKALSWAQQQSDPRAKEQALLGLSEAWAQNDPKAAAAFALSLKPGDEQNSLISSVASALASENPADAMKWAFDLPAGNARNESLAQIADSWGQAAPGDAARFVSSLTASEVQAEMASKVVENWMKSDPKAAADWMLSLPDTTKSRETLGTVMESWAEYDPASASKWLADMEPGGARDTAISSFAAKIAELDPGAAAKWAENIANKQQRMERYESIARAWIIQDEGRARAWIDTLPISKETKENWAKPQAEEDWQVRGRIVPAPGYIDGD